MLLSQAIKDFLTNQQAKDRSSETIRGYGMVLNEFNRITEKKYNSKLYLDEVTLQDMEDYLEFRRALGDQPVSRNRALYIFRSFFSYLIKRGLVVQDISQNLEPVSVNQKERVHLSEEEQKQLFGAILHNIVRPASITMAYTGIRVSELTNLELKDVDLIQGILYVRKGKGNKSRKIPISNRLLIILKDYLANDRPQVNSNYFFATGRTGKLSPVYINRILKQTTGKLGWEKVVTAHILRHSFASNLIKSNAKLPSVQALLGHSDLRVTSRYIHQDFEELEDTVNLLH